MCPQTSRQRPLLMAVPAGMCLRVLAAHRGPGGGHLSAWGDRRGHVSVLGRHTAQTMGPVGPDGRRPNRVCWRDSPGLGLYPCVLHQCFSPEMGLVACWWHAVVSAQGERPRLQAARASGEAVTAGAEPQAETSDGPLAGPSSLLSTRPGAPGPAQGRPATVLSEWGGDGGGLGRVGQRSGGSGRSSSSPSGLWGQAPAV